MAIPIVVIAVLFAAGSTIGLVGLVFVVGVAAASVVYVKNRTDRHNAAVDRGEIRVVADPHVQSFAVGAMDEDVVERLRDLGYRVQDLGAVARFDGGWIVKRRDRNALAVVVGDDGEFARFDPTRVDDLRAASEYQAGRGRDRTGS